MSKNEKWIRKPAKNIEKIACDQLGKDDFFTLKKVLR